MQRQGTSRTNNEDRVQRLKWRIVEAPQEICIERARYLTQAMREHWENDALTRISLALEHILKNISVTIRDEELLVGCRTAKLKGAPFFPENKVRWIEGDLDGFENRSLQKALISENEKTELREEILPFWRGKTVEDRLEELLPEDVAVDMDKYIFTMMLEITYGIGHFTINHGKVLAVGLKGVIQEATGRYNALSATEQSGAKGLFYTAVIRTLNAAIVFANRYADLANAMATTEKNPARRQELQEITAICRHVPENPASSFREAIQSVYFIHLIAQIESGGNSISLGRIDQILLPFYRADRDKGIITPAAARELLSLLFIKTNEIWNVLEEAFIAGGEGTEGKTTQNVTVGGMGKDGQDATNELSYIGLDAYAAVRTVQPNFGVRTCAATPMDFFCRAADYARDGVLMHFFADEKIVASLVAAGHSLEDARDYGVVGCLEPSAQGKTFGSTFAVQFNGIKCLELALSNGVDNIFGYQSGTTTENPADFKSLNEVWRAYDAQFSYFINQMVRGMECLDRAIAELVPSPFASAMIAGALDKGIDLTRGGAIYNSTGVQLMGFANIADSLYALDKVIFTDKRYSMQELVEWLTSDWLDAADKRAYFLHKVAKYGNDIDEVDAYAARVIQHFCEVLSKYKNFRGGAFWAGIFSVGFHIAMGAFTGATSDGRAAGAFLGNGITPTEGNAKRGPTAIINSATKLPITMVTNGANLNMRFEGKKISTENLLTLIKTYFDKGGTQVQFNMLDEATLREAQKKPEQYRDLIVRVSGYSAEFTGLSEIAQEEIINRTKFEL